MLVFFKASLAALTASPKSRHRQQKCPHLLIPLSLSPPAGESGYYAEAAFGDGHWAPAPVQLQFTSERILRRGGRPWHHEQPAGRD